MTNFFSTHTCGTPIPTVPCAYCATYYWCEQYCELFVPETGLSEYAMRRHGWPRAAPAAAYETRLAHDCRVHSGPVPFH